MQVLGEILKAIRDKRLDPDAGRAERFSEPKVVIEIKEETVDHGPPASGALDDSTVIPIEDDDGYVTTSSESDSEMIDEPHHQERARAIAAPCAPVGMSLWQRSRWKTLHLVDDMYPSGFRCGRLKTVPVSVRYDAPLCSVCWKGIDRGR